ncbi:MAG: hypothetical protein AAF328_04310 [Planctomycetota bacterium]
MSRCTLPAFVIALLAATSLVGCGATSYTTPGGPAALGAIAGFGGPASAAPGSKGTLLGGTSEKRTPRAEGFVELADAEPIAQFPTNVVAARIQAGNYRGEAVFRPSGANFSVVTARDVESDEAMDKLFKLPGVKQLQPMNRLLLPEKLRDAKDLREAAAVVRADMLLLYTFDTTFRQDDKDAGPFNILALGLLPNQAITVNSTASAVLLDTQSGFVYGVSEASAEVGENTNIWRGLDGVAALQDDAEELAFDRLVDELARMWTSVYSEYAKD